MQLKNNNSVRLSLTVIFSAGTRGVALARRKDDRAKTGDFITRKNRRYSRTAASASDTSRYLSLGQLWARFRPAPQWAPRKSCDAPVAAAADKSNRRGVACGFAFQPIGPPGQQFEVRKTSSEECRERLCIPVVGSGRIGALAVSPTSCRRGFIVCWEAGIERSLLDFWIGAGLGTIALSSCLVMALICKKNGK